MTTIELTDEEKVSAEEELKKLLIQFEDRKKNYSILDTTMDRIPKQKELF